jgi:hypothetical protein
VLSVAKAAANLPWLPSRDAAVRVACHLGCTPDDAELRIVSAGKDGRVKARGVIEDQPVSPLPAAWQGTINLAGTTMKCPESSYEITNLELCFIDLIATGLLPAPADRARWPAEEAVAYLVKDVPLPWREWQGAGAAGSEIERAEITLGEVIVEGVPAEGWHPIERRRRRIPSRHFRDEMIEKKPLRDSIERLWKVVVRIDGNVGTSPPSRIAQYTGPLWSKIEIDSVKLRQARPKPLTAQPPPKPASTKVPSAAKRRWRRGPQPGDIDRFGADDRALFPELTTLMKDMRITARQAAQKLVLKIKGVGGEESRIRRLAKRYRTEVLEKPRRKKSKKPAATRSHS